MGCHGVLLLMPIMAVNDSTTMHMNTIKTQVGGLKTSQLSYVGWVRPIDVGLDAELPSGCTPGPGTHAVYPSIDSK